MKLLCGIDEAGRGPLAGPVTAAAVILPEAFPFSTLNDSKRLSEKKREEVAIIIMEYSLAWAVGWAWPEEIDELNIHHATLLAMKRAYEGLAVKPDEVVVDGLFVPSVPVPALAIVKGDSTVHQIMAASIIAKTQRDHWMIAYAEKDPRYGFDKHKGYPTKEHRMRIERYGPCSIHRKSFTLCPPA